MTYFDYILNQIINFILYGTIFTQILATIYTNTSSHYLQIKYYKNYHRSISESEGLTRNAIYYTKYILFIVLPFLLIISLYTLTLIYISRSSRRHLTTMRMYYVTLAFAITAVVSWFPSMTADVASAPMSYPVAQVLTVTLFYLNSVSDPIIYLVGYPTATAHVRGLCGRVWKTCGLTRSRCNERPRLSF